jgi:hypothetical protein
MLALISVTISFKNNKILSVAVAFWYCSYRQRKAATVYLTHSTFVILKLMRRYIIRSMLISGCKENVLDQTNICFPDVIFSLTLIWRIRPNRYMFPRCYFLSNLNLNNLYMLNVFFIFGNDRRWYLVNERIEEEIQKNFRCSCRQISLPKHLI